MINKKTFLIILIFIVLGAFIRIWGLDRVPPNLSNDEISLAYDSYSISKTLKDEHNQFLPISFKSQDTYKAPLTVYLTIPSILIFGNNDFGARLPSAFFGVLIIFVMAILVYQLTGDKKLAILVSALIAFTPWSLIVSRMLLETNISLFFLLAGLMLFFVSVNDKKDFKINRTILIYLSFISFAFSMYAYHTEWGLVPLLLVGLGIIYKERVFKNIHFWLGLGLFFIILTPLVIDYINISQNTTRANTELFFSKILNDQQANIFTKSAKIVSTFVSNYSSYTSPGYLFLFGNNIPTSFSNYKSGLFIFVLLPFFIAGLFNIKKYLKKNSRFFWYWLIVSPLIPALTLDSGSLVRNLPSIAPYCIVIGIGLLVFWERFHNIIFRGAIVATIVSSLVFFLIIYFVNYPNETAAEYQWYKILTPYLKAHYDEYDQILIDNRFGEGLLLAGVPHYYIAYYTEYDPQKFLQERNDIKGGITFGKYVIKPISWEKINFSPKTLYIVSRDNPILDSVMQEHNIKLIDRYGSYHNKPIFLLYASP